MNLTESVCLMIKAGSRINRIESAIRQIERSAVSEYKRRLSESESFIEIDDFDLVTEQRDARGFRRYSLKNSVDGAIMLPDSEGFWTPVNDLVNQPAQ